jgi:DNA-binding transcriptional LysR family regulator
MLDPLTLDQLRIFLSVAELGSFSAASRRLNRVQSAISQSITSLETTLSIKLFDRSAKYPVLTDAGKALISEAVSVLHEADQFKAKASAIAGGLEAELAIAVDPLFPNKILMEALRAVERTYSSLSIRLVTETIGAAEVHLRSSNVSLAIYSLDTTGATDLESEFLLDIDMIPVVASFHPLAKSKRSLRKRDLDQVTQLVLSSRQPENWSRGIVGSKIWRFVDLQTRYAFLMGGFGWCNMPAHLIFPALEEGELVRLNIEGHAGFNMPLHAVRRRQHPLGLGAVTFLNHLRSNIVGGVTA